MQVCSKSLSEDPIKSNLILIVECGWGLGGVGESRATYTLYEGRMFGVIVKVPLIRSMVVIQGKGYSGNVHSKQIQEHILYTWPGVDRPDQAFFDVVAPS